MAINSYIYISMYIRWLCEWKLGAKNERAKSDKIYIQSWFHQANCLQIKRQPQAKTMRQTKYATKKHKHKLDLEYAIKNLMHRMKKDYSIKFFEISYISNLPQLSHKEFWFLPETGWHEKKSFCISLYCCYFFEFYKCRWIYFQNWHQT